MTIPTAKELDEWVAAMEKGQAVTEMLPRFVAGYRALLNVAEKAEAAVETFPAGARHNDGSDVSGSFIVAWQEWERLGDLEEALVPVRDALKGQKALALEDP